MRRIWDRAGRTIDRISRWSGWVSGILLVPLTVVVFYAAIMRRFATNPDWAFEVSIFIYGTALVMAGAEVLRRGEHVSVDILPNILPERPRRILILLITTTIVLVGIVIMTEGIQTAWHSTSIGERSGQQTTFNPPIWWFRWVFPLATGLLILQAIRHLGDQMIALTRRKESKHG